MSDYVKEWHSSKFEILTGGKTQTPVKGVTFLKSEWFTPGLVKSSPEVAFIDMYSRWRDSDRYAPVKYILDLPRNSGIDVMLADAKELGCRQEFIELVEACWDERYELIIFA